MTYLLLDTSTPVCKVTIVTDDGVPHDHEWQADRGLAKGLLRYLLDTLSEYSVPVTDLKGIGVFQGPGSFTGLRIGLTVVNTLADASSIPIVGTGGDSWQDEAMMRLNRGDNDQIVMPVYGHEARITTPRK